MEQERKAQFSPQRGCVHVQVQPGTFLVPLWSVQGRLSAAGASQVLLEEHLRASCMSGGDCSLSAVTVASR